MLSICPIGPKMRSPNVNTKREDVKEVHSALANQKARENILVPSRQCRNQVEGDSLRMNKYNGKETQTWFGLRMKKDNGIGVSGELGQSSSAISAKLSRNPPPKNNNWKFNFSASCIGPRGEFHFTLIEIVT